MNSVLTLPDTRDSKDSKNVMPGVQIVEVCMASQHKTGGLLELGQLRQKLISSRGRSQHHQDITIDDLLRATKKLKILGTGFTVIPLNSGRYLVQSVPGEMSLDQVSVLDQAEKYRGLVTENILQENLHWDQQRSGLVLGEQIDIREFLSNSPSLPSQSEWWDAASCGWTARAREVSLTTGSPAYSAPASDFYL